MSGRKNIFFALAAMLLWGTLFPFVKIGYTAFGTNTSSIADIFMFAGVRFTVCGLLICAYCLIKKEKLNLSLGSGILPIIITGLFAVTLHYAFLYIGMTTADSSKTAILKQIGSVFYICIAPFFIKCEKFGVKKLIGAALGFSGIIAINAGVGGVSFSMGDLFIILASLCSVVSGIAGKKSTEGNSPVAVTGVSQLFGGVILIVAALIMGAGLPDFNSRSVPVFAYICFATIAGYLLWYCVLEKGSLSNLYIIKFAEPAFACVFSALLLGESILKLQYLSAFVLIALGIVIGSSEAGSKKKTSK